MTDHSTQFDSLPAFQRPQSATVGTPTNGSNSNLSANQNVVAVDRVSESQNLLGAAEDTTAHAFGGKSISFMGSIVLLVNNIMGPAMVTIPLVYHLGGFLSTTVILLLTFIVSSFSATMLCEAMQRIPGNHDFQLRYEFATTMGHYFGKRAEVAGQILVNGCLMASAMASIIVAAQVMDDFLVFTFGRTFGVHFIPPYQWLSINISSETMFDTETYVLSLGYLLCAVICIPFGYFNLDDNMYFQWFSFLLLLGTIFEFLIAFCFMPLNTDLVSVLGKGLEGQVLVLGVISFSWAYIITVPSWVNEKQSHVSVNKTVWISTLLGLFLKFSFGYMAAIAFVNRSQSSNILNVMTAGSTLHGAFRTFTSVCVYFYSIGTIIPGIPVYSILIRYNLVNGELLRPFFANLIAVVFPWAFSCFFYHGSGFSAFVNWSSLLLQGLVNFVIPCALYYQALRKYPITSVLHHDAPDSKKQLKKKLKKALKKEAKALKKEAKAARKLAKKNRSGKHGHLQDESTSCDESSPSNASASEDSDSFSHGGEIEPCRCSREFGEPECDHSQDGAATGVVTAQPDSTHGVLQRSGSNRTIEIQHSHSDESDCVENIEAVKEWMLINPKILAIIFIIFFTLISIFTIVMNAIFDILDYLHPNTTNVTEGFSEM